MNNNSNTPAGTVEAVIDLFFAAFTERDTTTRNNLLERAVVREVSHWSRKGMVGSRTELSAAIGVYQSTYEDLTLQLVGEVQTFRDVARAAWELYAPDEQRYQKGESYFEFGDDGRLKEIVEFSDPPHNRPFGGGPQVYVDAWNRNVVPYWLTTGQITVAGWSLTLIRPVLMRWVTRWSMSFTWNRSVD